VRLLSFLLVVGVLGVDPRGTAAFFFRDVKFDFSLLIMGGMSDFSRLMPGLSADIVCFVVGVTLILESLFMAFFFRAGIESSVFDRVITGRGMRDAEASGCRDNNARGIFDDFTTSASTPKSVCVDILHDRVVNGVVLFFVEMSDNLREVLGVLGSRFSVLGRLKSTSRLESGLNFFNVFLPVRGVVTDESHSSVFVHELFVVGVVVVDVLNCRSCDIGVSCCMDFERDFTGLLVVFTFRLSALGVELSTSPL